MHPVLELLELERPVVHRRGQPEAVVDQRLLAAAVAVPHAVHLRNRGVALVHKEQEVAREVVEQRRRRLARQPPAEVARVVLDAVAVAHGLDHLQIEARALVDALRLHHAALRLEMRHPLVQLGHDRIDGLRLALRLHHVVALGIDRQPRILLLHRAEQRIDLRERFDLVAEQLDAVGVLVVGGEDLNHVAAHAKCPAPEVRVVALVENLDQPPRNVFAADVLALFEQQQHAVVGLRRPQAVDAAHRAHDDRVAPLEQAARRREPQLVQLLVDRGFLLDVEVAGGNVRLGLVVVVVADEILDRVRREELLELVVELRGQRLVVRQDQRRPVGLLDHLGHGEGLARAGHAQQHLVLFARPQPLHKLVDGARLVALGLVAGDELKVHKRIIRQRGERLANLRFTCFRETPALYGISGYMVYNTIQSA